MFGAALLALLSYSSPSSAQSVCVPGESCDTGDSGICAEGICLEGEPPTCEFLIFPGQFPETCGNGLDDDCNGQADEPEVCGCVPDEPCDSGEPGICSSGLTSCPDPFASPVCLAQVEPGAESCGNSTDEDCDGFVNDSDVCGDFWTGAGTDDFWTTGANWFDQTPPAAQETVVFDATDTGGTNIVDQDFTISRLDYEPGGIHETQLASGATLQVDGDVFVGFGNGSATATWSGAGTVGIGTPSAPTFLTIGRNNLGGGTNAAGVLEALEGGVDLHLNELNLGWSEIGQAATGTLRWDQPDPIHAEWVYISRGSNAVGHFEVPETGTLKLGSASDPVTFFLIGRNAINASGVAAGTLDLSPSSSRTPNPTFEAYVGGPRVDGFLPELELGGKTGVGLGTADGTLILGSRSTLRVGTSDQLVADLFIGRNSSGNPASRGTGLLEAFEGSVDLHLRELNLGWSEAGQAATGTLRWDQPDPIHAERVYISRGSNAVGHFEVPETGTLKLGSASDPVTFFLIGRNAINATGVAAGTLDLSPSSSRTPNPTFEAYVGGPPVDDFLPELEVGGKTGVGLGTADGTLILGSRSTLRVGTSDQLVADLFIGRNSSGNPASRGTGLLEAFEGSVDLHLRELNLGWSEAGQAATGTLRWDQPDPIHAERVYISRGSNAVGHFEVPETGTLKLGSASDPVTFFLIGRNAINATGVAAGTLDLSPSSSRTPNPTFEAYVGGPRVDGFLPELELGGKTGVGLGTADGTLILGSNSVLRVGTPAQPADLFIGRNLSSDPSSDGRGFLQASTGEMEMHLDRLLVGESAGGQPASGVFEMGIGDVSANLVQIGVGAGSGGTVALSGGVLQAASVDVGNNGTFDFLGGVLTVDIFNGTLRQQGGILAPGASPGLTTINGNYELSSGGALEAEIFGLADVEFDRIQVNGAVSLAADSDGGGSLQLVFGFSPPLGSTFPIVENDGSDVVIGEFAGLPEGGETTFAFGGTEIPVRITYQGGDGNDVVVTTIATCQAGLPCETGLDGVCAAGLTACPDALGPPDCETLILPGQLAEECDGLDNDCNGTADDGLSPDADSDGFTAVGSCEGSANDCVDTNPDVFPGAPELCDEQDNDCDDEVDEGLTEDVDSDGFTAVGSCEGSADDCVDTDPAIFPGASELCDGADNDCDVNADEDFTPPLGDTCTVGVGACEATGAFICTADGSGTVCDAIEGEPSPEVCGNGVDEDCDGAVNDSDVCGDFWTGAGGDGLWTSGPNWLDGSPPKMDDSVTFNATDSGGTNRIDTDFSISSLRYTDNGTHATEIEEGTTLRVGGDVAAGSGNASQDGTATWFGSGFAAIGDATEAFVLDVGRLTTVGGTNVGAFTIDGVDFSGFLRELNVGRKSSSFNGTASGAFVVASGNVRIEGSNGMRPVINVAFNQSVTSGPGSTVTGTLDALNGVVDLDLEELNVARHSGNGGVATGVLRWNQVAPIHADRIYFGRGRNATGVLEVPGGGSLFLGTHDQPIGSLRLGYHEGNGNGGTSIGNLDLRTSAPTFEVHVRDDLSIGRKVSTSGGAADASMLLGSNSLVHVGTESQPADLHIGFNQSLTSGPSSTVVGLLDALEGVISLDLRELNVGAHSGNGGSARGTLRWDQPEPIRAEDVYVGRGRESTGSLEVPEGGTLLLGSPDEPIQRLRVAYHDASGGGGTAFANLDFAEHTPTFEAYLGSELSVGRVVASSGGSADGTLVLGEGSTLSIGSPAVPGNVHIGHNQSVSSGPSGSAVGTCDLSMGGATLHLRELHVGRRSGNVGSASGELTLGGTNLIVASDVQVGTGPSSTGVLNLLGGTLAAGAVTLGPGGSFNFQGGRLELGAFQGTLMQRGGTLAPGGSPGQSSIEGDYVLGSGELEVELFGPATTESDRVQVTGSVNLDPDKTGGASLALAFGFTPVAGSSFTIIDNDESDLVAGQFAGLPEGFQGTESFGGIEIPFRITYRGGDGNDVVITVLAACEVGVPCATGLDGVCAEGLTTCPEPLGEPVCEPQIEPGQLPEVCDGLDNDCDGSVDEDLGETTCGLGECEHTIQNCVDGVEQECDPFEGAVDEICDGLDNDCDGPEDEDFDPPLGDTCTVGMGECEATGAFICTADQQGTVCDAVPGDPSPEICGNDVDEDCNGVAEECVCVPEEDCDTGLPGVCALGATRCPDPAAASVCEILIPPGELEEVCGNELDEDCDGSLDNGCPILIDNDLNAGQCVEVVTLGPVCHVSLEMGPAGESPSPAFSAFTVLAADGGENPSGDFVVDYLSFVDPGAIDGAIGLSADAIEVLVDQEDPDQVMSSGSFMGENGRIAWMATSSIGDLDDTMNTTFMFIAESGTTLGRLRFFQYLDGGVGIDPDAGDRNLFFSLGSAETGNLELFTLGEQTRVGISQSGAVAEGAGGLTNARFAGCAAGVVPSMRDRIESGEQVLTPGAEEAQAPCKIDDGLVADDEGRYGPADIVSVMAWDVVDPIATAAFVVTTLGGVPVEPEPRPECQSLVFQQGETPEAGFFQGHATGATGIASVTIVSGQNARVVPDPEFEPEDPSVAFRLERLDPTLPASATVEVTNDEGEMCQFAEKEFPPVVFPAFDAGIWGEALDVYRGGGQALAFVAAQEEGLQVYDMTDPAAPVFVNQWIPGAETCPLGGFYADSLSLVEGGPEMLATVAAGGCGFVAVGVDDVTQTPFPVRSQVAIPGGWIKDAAVESIGGRTFAYLASFFEGLQVVDWTDPASPRVVGSVGAGASNASFGQALAVKSRQVGEGALVYVATTLGLRIVQTTPLGAPSLLGSLDFDPQGGFAVPQDVLLRGNLAFVPLWRGGLAVVDVGNSQSPRVVQTIPTGRAMYHAAVSESGEKLIVTEGLEGVKVFQVDPAADVPLSLLFDVGPEVGFCKGPNGEDFNDGDDGCWAWGVSESAGFAYITYGSFSGGASNAGGLQVQLLEREEGAGCGLLGLEPALVVLCIHGLRRRRRRADRVAGV